MTRIYMPVYAGDLLRNLDLVGSLSALAMVVVALSYLLFLTGAARSAARGGARVDASSRSAKDADVRALQIVVLMPCLNEESVIGPSVSRLLTDPSPELSVLVIDDGSDDATSEIVRALDDPRVALLRRDPPDARQGKGEALNQAVTVVRERYRELDPEQVIVGVVDADGHLDPSAWQILRDAFATRDIGAVQLGVRISNRSASLLARMQDIEFVTFTAIYQQGRRRLGSVGMGGNAQFVRLSALDALGTKPWTRSLTEDFDLGIRLNGTRWVNEYRGEAAVHQEGVTSLRRLVRQRTRWFQGNLQARALLGFVARELRGRARADTLWQVLSPYLLLAGSLLPASFLLMLVLFGMNLAWGVPQSWAWAPSAYLLAFGPSYLYALVYWRRVRQEGTGPLRCIAWCHVFVVYGLLSGIYGWRALARELVGRSGWAKTAREAARAPGALVGQAAAEAGA
ncbi:glycosyltransferase family 2 protein [Actinomyces sp. 432]|uniref:glycosyltransferase family 2 protein n=1 Tax=Actinomyces sp. 432 TaxID=2057798 RepID=UPI001F279569|nr:glycosyltransferase [Actinomyces sp. 432]